MCVFETRCNNVAERCDMSIETDLVVFAPGNVWEIWATDTGVLWRERGKLFTMS